MLHKEKTCLPVYGLLKKKKGLLKKKWFIEKNMVYCKEYGFLKKWFIEKKI